MNVFDNIIISNSELEYILELSESERIEYLFEIYELESLKTNNTTLNLNSFFDSLTDEEIPDDEFDEEEISFEDFSTVDVIIDSENILIESNSLRDLRTIKNHFMEIGYIIQRNKDIEKMFKKDKITRYLRVFTIINQIEPLCWN